MTDGKQGYYSLGEIIKAAILFERDSALYYAEMKKSTDREEALTLLDLLEEQEREHQRKLERIEMNKKSENVFIQFPPELALSMPELKKSNPSFEDLLDLTIEREVLSAEIYERSSVSAPHPIREVLQGLADFERVHERNLMELKLQ